MKKVVNFNQKINAEEARRLVEWGKKKGLIRHPDPPPLKEPEVVPPLPIPEEI